MPTLAHRIGAAHPQVALLVAARRKEVTEKVVDEHCTETLKATACCIPARTALRMQPPAAGPRQRGP